MKKPVVEERTFCDFCEELGYTECLLCEKDLCSKHRLEVVIYLDRQDYPFRASLCPADGNILLPILNKFQGKSTSWQKVGQSPEFNEARLGEILEFLKKAVPAAD